MSFVNEIYVQALWLRDGIINQLSGALDVLIAGMKIFDVQSDGIHLEAGKTVYTPTSQMATQDQTRIKLTWGSRLDTTTPNFLRYNGCGRGDGNTPVAFRNYHFAVYDGEITGISCMTSAGAADVNFDILVNNVSQATVNVAAAKQITYDTSVIAVSSGVFVSVLVSTQNATDPEISMCDIYMRPINTSVAYTPPALVAQSTVLDIDDVADVNSSNLTIDSTLAFQVL